MTNHTASTIGRTLRVSFWALLAFALVFLAVMRPGCGPLSNTTRNISGQVVDETGQPVPGAAVTFKWGVGLGLNTMRPSDERVVELTSDADGHFSGRGGSRQTGLYARKKSYYDSWLGVDEQMPTGSLWILLNTARHPQPMVGKSAGFRLVSCP